MVTTHTKEQDTINELQEEIDYLKQLLRQHNIPLNLRTHEISTKNEPVQNAVVSIKLDLTPNEKIELYSSFFIGRKDVYALRWENTKTKRSGYSPACANEWKPNVCNKPKIKCNACPNQKWRPITAEVLRAHLTGKAFVGVYPLLQDDRCNFLAIDFDKEQWQSDVTAFSNVCDGYSIEHLIERSQSGNGAHVWLFFDDAVPAIMARNLGTALLTLTMQQHQHLTMESYDRLFPNQDTMPRGGFGNLIALPLQGNRRSQGNSTFIDIHNGFIPYPDPWVVLEQTKKLSISMVESIMDKIQRETNIMDVEQYIPEQENGSPWEHKPEIKYPVIGQPLPQNIEIVKSDLLYVPTHSMPAQMINQIKKIAAFQNPEFYRAQAMRLSTYNKPRVIQCANVFADYVGLPRGCETPLFEMLAHYNISSTCVDRREQGMKIEAAFLGSLLPTQQEAVLALLKHEIGVLSATTGFGKTVIASYMIAQRKTNTLILVHRQQLLEQWQEKLMAFLGLDKKQIGCVKAGKLKLTNHIDIAMIQSLGKNGVVAEEVTQYGHVIVDECHHVSAFGFEQILKRVKAKYVLGLTATPFRKDGHNQIIFMQCGPIRFQTTKKSENESNRLNLSVYIKHTPFMPKEHNNFSSLHQQLIDDQTRNNIILQDVIQAFNQGSNPLVLTERTRHLDWFKQQLEQSGVGRVYTLQGGMRKKDRDRTMNELHTQLENRILLATGKYIGEGFDDPKLDVLFLPSPISWHGTLQQYVGRLYRESEQKSSIIVYDYVDINSVVLLKMYQKRVRKYKSMGYIIHEAN